LTWERNMNYVHFLFYCWGVESWFAPSSKKPLR
jgi:hypothetical protein